MISTLIVLAAMAQGPGGASISKEADVEDLVRRMMAFDKDGDGRLTRAEVSDARLLGLFDRADADADGAATQAELTALAEAEHSGPPGPDRRPGGPGPEGPPSGPGPRPGELLPPPVRQALGLSPEQRTELDALQAEIDAALAEILTEAQKQILKAEADRTGRHRPPGGPPR